MRRLKYTDLSYEERIKGIQRYLRVIKKGSIKKMENIQSLKHQNLQAKLLNSNTRHGAIIAMQCKKCMEYES
jgi:hypothetical protein